MRKIYEQILQMGKPITVAVLILLALRIVTIAVMGIMPQDAYYYFYAEHLSLSYFDHPPMVGWMLWLFTSVFGKSIYVIHAADFLVTLATICMFYTVAKRVLSPSKAVTTTLLFLSTLMVSILSLNTTPDVPLLFFWTLSLFFAHRAVTSDKAIDWMVTGIMMGASFLSKYTAVFLPAGLFLFLLLRKEHRSKLLTRFLPMFLITALVASPVLIWNLEHDFASFKFQGAKRATEMGSGGINLKNVAGLFAHQFAILLPVVFLLLAGLLYRFIKRPFRKLRTVSADTVFLLCFFLPLIGLFVVVSFFSWVKLNWMMPAYISGILWAGIYFKQKWLKYQLLPSLVISTAGLIFILLYPVPVKSDDTWWGWKQLNNALSNKMASQPGYFIFSNDNYKTTAVLNFLRDGEVYGGNILDLPALQFSITHKDAPQQLTGRNALFVDSYPQFKKERTTDSLLYKLNQHFKEVKLVDTIVLKTTFGQTARMFLIYDCREYKP